MSLSALSGVRVWLLDHRPFDSKVITWYEFIKKMIDKVSGNDLGERSAAVSFNLLLAVFPAVIFLFTLIPYIPITNIEGEIMGLLRRAIPAGTYEAVDSTIRDIISRERGGVLSFGFLATIYAATNGMVALMNAFHSSNEIPDKRGFFKIRLVRLIFALVSEVLKIREVLFALILVFNSLRAG